MGTSLWGRPHNVAAHRVCAVSVECTTGLALKGGVTSPKNGLNHHIAAAPSTQLVEKKAMLRVSRGLSWVQSGDRV